MAAAKAAPGVTEMIQIPRPNIQAIRAELKGERPLIVHAWSQKARQQMLDAQQKKPKVQVIRDPEADFMGARYIADEGWDGFPAVAFKAAMIESCRLVAGLTMTVARRLFFINPDGYSKGATADGYSQGRTEELVRIYGEPERREDMVRVGMGTADLRYRAQYWPWSVTVNIRYNAGMISLEQMLNLLELAGSTEGVGEWRPGKSDTGSYGLWSVERTQVSA